MKSFAKYSLATAAVAYGTGKLVKTLWKEKYRQEEALLDKSQKSSSLYYHWLLLKQNNIGLCEFFTEKEIKTVAVLSLSPPGRRLIEELSGSDVNVVYAIEQDNPSAVHERLDVLRLGDDPLPMVDAVIVCSLYDFGAIQAEIEKELGNGCRVFALETVIAETLENHALRHRDGVLDPLNLDIDE